MPRPRSPSVAAVKAKLLARLRDGLHRPGQRFFSNRGLAQTFGVSYQTAHRLIAELEAEGALERRAASGTYVAGSAPRLKGAELLFHARARRPDSFGARLLELLLGRLRRAAVSTRVTFVEGDAVEPSSRHHPIVWECPAIAHALARARHYVLLLNDRPPPGLAASFIDSVSTDDFSGGAAAAELLRSACPGSRCGVFAGPSTDQRSRQRVAGFQAILPESTVVCAETWYFDKAIDLAPRMLRYRGVFACNDRLAEAIMKAAEVAQRPPPKLVGFDDAPISEQLNFTTIAIPWDDIVEGAVNVIQRRLAGEAGPAAQLLFAPRPVMRGVD